VPVSVCIVPLVLSAMPRLAFKVNPAVVSSVPPLKFKSDGVADPGAVPKPESAAMLKFPALIFVTP